MFLRRLSRVANRFSSSIRTAMSTLIYGLKFAKEKIGRFFYYGGWFLSDMFDYFIRGPILSPIYYWIIAKFGYVQLAHGFTYINPQEFAAEIKAHPKATKIWIENSGGLQELDLEGIPDLPYLTVLLVRYTKMNGKAIEAIIKKAPNLQYITLDGVGGLDACDLTGLQPLNSLKFIHTQHCPAHVMEQLIKCAPNLEYLEEAQRGNLSTMNLEGLGNMPKLWRAFVFGTKINPAASATLIDKAPKLKNDSSSILSLSGVSDEQIIAKFPKVLHSIFPLFNSLYYVDYIIARLMIVTNRVLMFTLLQELSNDRRKEVLQNEELVQSMINTNLSGVVINPKPATDSNQFSILPLLRLNSKRAEPLPKNKSSEFVNDLRCMLFRYVGVKDMSTILVDHHAREENVRRNRLNVS
jgi:hypothetical protein